MITLIILFVVKYDETFHAWLLRIKGKLDRSFVENDSIKELLPCRLLLGSIAYKANLHFYHDLD